MSDGAEGPRMAQMSVSVNDGVVVVTVTGEVDLANAGEMRSALQEQLDPSLHGLVVDLALDFLGSTGLAVLIDVQRSAERDGVAFGVVTTTRSALRPLELTGLTETFSLFDSVPEAIKSLRQYD
jgi:anti-sigma B factor antagonist